MSLTTQVSLNSKFPWFSPQCFICKMCPNLTHTEMFKGPFGAHGRIPCPSLHQTRARGPELAYTLQFQNSNDGNPATLQSCNHTAAALHPS